MDVLEAAAVCCAVYILARYHDAQRAAAYCGCHSCRRELERWQDWGALDWERETPIAELLERDSDGTPFWR